MKPLHEIKCVPCEGGVTPLKRDEFEKYLPQIPTWQVVNDDHALQKNFEFKNFKETLDFVNKVGAIAELEGHHPDLNLHDWNKLTITLSTHAIGGLFINDFALAAKIDRL